MDSKEKGDIGEEFVNEIAYNTFLEYWCYPGPKYENGDKKEICDLLILFNETAIIVSVKNYEFKGQYDRYFRKTTDKALNQIQGAERRLFGNRRVFIKHPKRDIEEFKNEEYSRVYRIIVNLGDGLKFYSPSHYTKDGKHVTVMERSSWESILLEMDTVADFTNYLDARERLFKNRPVIMLPGEEHDFDRETGLQFFKYAMDQSDNQPGQVLISGTESDLLSQYITNQNDYPEKLKSDDAQGLFLQIDGHWENFIQKPEVKEKKKRDTKSYFIDEFVKREVLQSEKGELIAQKLMSLSRFERRMLTDSLFGFIRKYESYESDSFFARGYYEIGNYGFVLVFYSIKMDPEQVQVLCSLTIDSFMIYTKYKQPEIILIGSTKNMRQLKFGYSKVEKLSNDLEEQIMKDAKSLGWFTKLEEGKRTDHEY